MSWIKWKSENNNNNNTNISLGGCLSEPDDDGKCRHSVPKNTCYFCLTGTEPKPCGDDIEKPDSFGDSGMFKNV